MNIMLVRCFIFCMTVFILTGCGNRGTDRKTEAEPKQAETLEESDREFSVPETVDEEEAEVILKEPELPEEPVDYQVRDVAGLICQEEEIALSQEDGQASGESALLSDTVEYVESEKKEITELRSRELTVDENDPDTYRIVRKEQIVEVTEEIPEEYTDELGNVKYAFLNESWYKYRYSSGDISMPGEQDEETALFLLNLTGEYDDYEVVKVESSVLEEEGEEPVYAYHVLYRKSSVIDGLPEDLEGLTVSRTRQEVTTKTEIVEEKVPVTVEEEVGTGEYIYYGWQEIEGDTYYFDKSGEKVTGMQVIQGIRYLFDDHGVLLEGSGVSVSSRNGAVDWEKVSDSGIEFALIRCGYRGTTGGMLIQDARCEENIIGARRSGIDVSICFYSQAVTEKEAVEEASVLAAMAQKHQISTPLVLDVGYTTVFEGRTSGLSVEDRTTLVKAFCRTLQNAGFTPMIHGNHDWLDNYLNMSELREYPLWLAQYNANVTYAGPWEIWQYTAGGTVEGINGHTGLSIKHEK